MNNQDSPIVVFKYVFSLRYALIEISHSHLRDLQGMSLIHWLKGRLSTATDATRKTSTIGNNGTEVNNKEAGNNNGNSMEFQSVERFTCKTDRKSIALVRKHCHVKREWDMGRSL